MNKKAFILGVALTLPLLLYSCGGGGGSSESSSGDTTTLTLSSTLVSGQITTPVSSASINQLSVEAGQNPVVELIVDLNKDGVFDKNTDKYYSVVAEEDGSFIVSLYKT